MEQLLSKHNAFLEEMYYLLDFFNSIIYSIHYAGLYVSGININTFNRDK